MGAPDVREKVKVAELLWLFFSKKTRYEITGLYLHLNCPKADLAHHPKPSIILAAEPSIVSSPPWTLSG